MKLVVPAALLCTALAASAQPAGKSKECRWSWKQFRCVAVAEANDPARCTFSKRLLRCVPKDKEQAPPSAGGAVGSKAAQSKVSPQQQAQPTTQQPQKQQQKQPQPTQQQAAPAWLAPLQRGMGLQQANRWAEAVAAYRESLALATSFRSDGERVQVLYTANTNLGLALQNVDQPAEAVTAFDAALEAVPENGDGHHNRANALYKSGRHADAAKAYARAIELTPTDGESYFGLGNAHDKLGEAEQAASAFASTLALDPTDSSAMYNLANAYRTLGRTGEAVGHYRGALKATPRNAAMHANLGHTLDASGAFSEAASSFTTALSIAPKDVATYTALGHTYKSAGLTEKAVEAYKAALALEPNAAGAYAGLGTALKQIDPKAAAEAFTAAAQGGGTGPEAEGAKAFRAWLGASPPPPPLPSARKGGPRAWSAVQAAARYPEAFEGRARACAEMTMAEAVGMGSDRLLQQGPTLLRNATSRWRLQAALTSGDGDAALSSEVGEAAMRMLVMPTDVHPTLEPAHAALVEPAASGIYFGDYLRLLDRLQVTEEFAVYVAQMNLLRLPPLLKQVCLPDALPSAKLTMTNLWVGGHSMKNGLHFDVFDNLLHQLSGRKRALIFPPHDTPHLYYATKGANIRRHAFSLEGDGSSGSGSSGSGSSGSGGSGSGGSGSGGGSGSASAAVVARGFANETVHEAVRQNVAVINVFDEGVGQSHPDIAKATPYVCELGEGDALFLPKNWHHAVISSAETARNVAVNTWYDLRGSTTPLSRVSALEDLFQGEGCA